MTLKVADLFCGTGGFSHGFSQTGEFKTVLGVEIRSASCKTFAANHPEAMTICGDIREVSPVDLANRLGNGSKAIDVLIGGPPCQVFSSIRPFRSINQDDRRNNLFEQYALFVDFFKPTFIVFENVVGLLRHKNGESVSQIRQVIESLGYACDFAVLNAVHFGVPQKRERVILLGRRGTRKPVFPAPTHFYDGKGMAGPNSIRSLSLFDSKLPPAVTVEKAICDLPPVSAGEAATEYLNGTSPLGYATERRKGEKKLTLHSATNHTPRMLEIIPSLSPSTYRHVK